MAISNLSSRSSPRRKALQFPTARSSQCRLDSVAGPAAQSALSGPTAPPRPQRQQRRRRPPLPPHSCPTPRPTAVTTTIKCLASRAAAALFPSHRFVTGLVSFQCVAPTSSPSSEATIPYRPSMSADPPSFSTNSATFSSQIPGNDPPSISNSGRLPSSPLASNPVHSQSSSPDQPLVMVGTAAATAAAAAAAAASSCGQDPALLLPPERMGSISPSCSSPTSLSTAAQFLGSDKANNFNGSSCFREISELTDCNSFYAQPFLKTHNSHMEKIQYYSSPAASQPVNYQQQQQAAAAAMAAAAAAAAQMVYVDPYAPAASTPTVVWPPQQVVQPTLYIPGSPQDDFSQSHHYQQVQQQQQQQQQQQLQQQQLYSQTAMSPMAANFIPASPAQPVSAPDPVSGSVARGRGPLFSETIVHQYLAEPTQP